MFVFGDDFADNGNLPKLPGGQPQSDLSRQWSYPYGPYINPRRSAAAVPTGCFSNNRIQSDFIAPPAYMHTLDQSVDPTGMTFASGGAGVFQKKVPTLAAWVKSFTRLINSGIISKDQLRHSVALVAISGNDYMSGADVKNSFLSSFDDVSSSRTHTSNLNTNHPSIYIIIDINLTD
ncbi:GDSL esterase/lipase At2g36325-like [Aegilops tauschii subsp. strangulata]|uniref:GDSL esterase/lipase At2g36325-like n=1 Tax=Aegilops tauschii subsp. strangulata TaxID=200361 RepID=UPI00098ACCFD|nr:GDSL esterase/lipase At5g08460-like [Aegilops tauschii subsp. strangulata]